MKKVLFSFTLLSLAAPSLAQTDAKAKALLDNLSKNVSALKSLKSNFSLSLASANGMNRSAIDNYFVRKKLSRHAQILIKRFMDGQEALAASNEVSSLITVPLKNRIINLAMKAAVRKNLTLEEFMAWAVEGAAKNVEEEK